MLWVVKVDKKSLKVQMIVRSCLLKMYLNFDSTDMIELISLSIYLDLFKYLQLQ